MTPASFRATSQRPVLTGAVALWLAVSLASCGSDDLGAPMSTLDVPETIALGELPDEVATVPSAPSIPGTVALPTSTTTTAVPEPEPIVGPIGGVAAGPRVLLIGDTVMAATAPRFDGIMCDVLADLGWQVEIDAEPGRFLAFAAEVLDVRLDAAGEPPWDVVGLMFGNHYDDLATFRRQLDETLDRLTSRPVILYTVTESDDVPADVNDAIRDQAARRANVVLVDWADLTAAEPEKLLDGDGLHLTEAGAGRLVIFTAAALGNAPVITSPVTTSTAITSPAITSPVTSVETSDVLPATTETGVGDGAPDGSADGDGACLPTSFDDDSAIVL